MGVVGVRSGPFLALILGSLFALAATPAVAEEGKGVSASIVVNAPALKCWDTIVAQRTAAPEKRRVISQDGNRAVLEEKYRNLPVIGDAYMQYEEIATPHTVLEAHLIKSDKFKAFESRWTLTPSPDGNTTTIKLYTYLNTGLWVPFAQQLTNRQTRQDITDRLKYIKKLSEASP